MRITRYEYSEQYGDATSWQVNRFAVDRVNLFVGRNATGKSRLVTSMNALAALISRTLENRFDSGAWNVRLVDGRTRYDISIEIEDREIKSERLVIDGSLRLKRDATGAGQIWYSELNEMVRFKSPADALAISTRRDEIQHPYLEPLFMWADFLRLYSFSGDLGQRTVYFTTDEDFDRPHSSLEESAPKPIANTLATVEQYVAGFDRFGEDFDKAILRDFEKVGYHCLDIRATALPDLMKSRTGRLPVMLEVEERGVHGAVSQLQMSTGMFRALASIIQVNFACFAKLTSTIIFDDIGEGLDYERSAKLVNLLMAKCRQAKTQLILTSNDRFVMNEVPLKIWHILTRNGGEINVRDYHNSKELFDSFSFIGLSNFDFFSEETRS